MRPHIRRIVDFLGAAGAENAHVQPGGKHPRIVFIWRGVERFYIVLATPSDDRAQHNAISDLRHMLGLVDGAKRVGVRRSRLP